MFTFSPNDKTLSTEDMLFASGRITFRFGHGTIDGKALNWVAGDGVCTAVDQGLEFEVACGNGPLRIAVANHGREAVHLEDIAVLFPAEAQDPALRADEYLEFIHLRSLDVGSGVKRVGARTRWADPNPSSSMVYVLKRIDAERACLFGALPPHRGDYVAFKAAHGERHLEGAFGVEIRSEQQCQILPGAKARMSAVEYRAGTCPIDLLKAYGRELGDAVPAPLKARISGWNSWDYYAGAVTPEHIYENQAVAAEQFGDALTHFVIDEGWEPRWGVWEANWKFRDGLKAHCRKIETHHGVPGVWVAPLLVNVYTSLYRDHPDWFGRDAQGGIVQELTAYGPMAYLDVTHPAAEAFVVDTFSRLRGEGFDYFKIDFTHKVLDCTRFHDPTVARGNILRKAFAAIRRAVGADAYILSCGAPFESVHDIVDAARICGDIHNFWSHICANAGAIAARWWLQGKAWNSDPDFLIVRTQETSPGKRFNREFKPRPFDYRDFWLSGREMNLNEAKVYALLLYVSAGDMVLGDNLAELNESGIGILKKVLAAPLRNAAVPVDLFDHHDALPSVWVARENGFVFVAVFNWNETPRDFEVDLAPFLPAPPAGIRTFWDSREVPCENGKLRIHLGQRSAEGFVLK